jgi:hypothetical protein
MAISKTSMDQQYGMRGLNMITPDQVIDEDSKTAGQSPFTINTRLLAPQETSDPRAGVQSRRGITQYTLPVGEAVDAVNTTTTGQANNTVSYLARRAQRFTPTANKALTAIEILVKNNGSNDNLIIDVYEDVSGNLGTKIASSSVARGSITDAYTYVKARFAQAPTLSTATNYWIVTYTQDEAYTTSYHLASTTTGANAISSVDAGANWAAFTGSFNFKVYLSDVGTVVGTHRFVTKAGLKQTLFAFRTTTGTSIYRVTNESTGTVTAIKTGLSPLTTRVRFKTAYDKVLITTGYDAMGKWDGTTYTSSTHTVDFPIPDNVTIYHDRAWYYSKSEPTKLYFSELYPNLETVLSVNFQYVPDTASADPITGFIPFQDQLVIFTKESKYTLLGDDVSTLGLSQSAGGTKGAVSQEAIAMGEKVVYFISLDGGAYYYDGAQDIGLSDNVQPEIDDITDFDSIDTIVTEKEWRIYYKPTGSLTHTKMLLLDLRFQEWLMDTETYTRLPLTFSLEDNTLIEASSTCGALYFGEAGLSQLGAPIKFRYWTNYKKYTSGIAKDRVKTFRAIFASPDRTTTVKIGKDADFDNDAKFKNIVLNSSGVLYDSGETYGSDTAVYGRGSRISQPKVSLSGRAENTQFRFEKDVIGILLSLYGYEAIIKSGRPR